MVVSYTILFKEEYIYVQAKWYTNEKLLFKSHILFPILYKSRLKRDH